MKRVARSSRAIPSRAATVSAGSVRVTRAPRDDSSAGRSRAIGSGPSGAPASRSRRMLDRPIEAAGCQAPPLVRSQAGERHRRRPEVDAPARVQLAELAVQDGDRPAVEHGVVHDHHEDVVVGAEDAEREAHQRRIVQREWQAGPCLRQTNRGARRVGGPDEVDDLERRRHLLGDLDARHPGVAHERGAERLVPRHERVQARGQPSDVEAAPEPVGPAEVVRRGRSGPADAGTTVAPVRATADRRRRGSPRFELCRRGGEPPPG